MGCFDVQYFVSHFWGHAFSDFVECLHRHSDDAARSPTHFSALTSQRNVHYWVCSFANNQWQLQDELGASWEDSSFYLSLCSSTGIGTVMILDSSLMPLRRYDVHGVFSSCSRATCKSNGTQASLA